MKYSKFTPIDASLVTSQQLELVHAAFGGDVPEVWREIVELNFAALRFCVGLEKIPDQVLAEAAVGTVYQFISSFGGNSVYLPNGNWFVKKEQAILIANEYRGNNIRELARKNKCTEMRIRQILKEQAALEKDQRQEKAVSAH